MLDSSQIFKRTIKLCTRRYVKESKRLTLSFQGATNIIDARHIEL